jgi:hypothetical protein
MFEFIIVLAIVAIAAYFTIKKLIRQLKGRGCDGCHGSCGLADRNLEELIRANEKKRKS